MDLTTFDPARKAHGLTILGWAGIGPGLNVHHDIIGRDGAEAGFASPITTLVRPLRGRSRWRRRGASGTGVGEVRAASGGGPADCRLVGRSAGALTDHRHAATGEGADGGGGTLMPAVLNIANTDAEITRAAGKVTEPGLGGGLSQRFQRNRHRGQGRADRVLVSANSPDPDGAVVRGTGEKPLELTGLTARQRQRVADVLNLIEARLKTRWDIT